MTMKVGYQKFSDDGEAYVKPVSPGLDSDIGGQAVWNVGWDYQKITTLAADVTFGTGAAGVGDYLDDVFIVIKTAASTVQIKDDTTVLYEWPSLAVGVYGPYKFGRVSKVGAWKANINNGSSTGSFVTLGGRPK